MKSCLLCGIGGQGTVLASRVIAAAAMNRGLIARTAETIGMAQRGGCVVSHVRLGQAVPSPLIPLGEADLLLGFEPGEAARCLGYLKPGGTAIVCDRAVAPVTAALGGLDYRGAEMLAYLRQHTGRLYVLDTAALAAACGSHKALNVALLGALARTGLLGLTEAEIWAALKDRVKPQYLAMNEIALRCGAESIGNEL